MEKNPHISTLSCEGCNKTFQRPRSTYLSMEPNEANCCDPCIQKNKQRQLMDCFGENFRDYELQIALTTNPEQKKKLQAEKRQFLQALLRQGTEK